jgi:hypothetical protein
MPVKRTRMLKMWNRGFLVFWKILLVGWQCRIYIVAHSYYMMVVHRIYHMVTTMIISPWYLKNRRKNTNVAHSINQKLDLYSCIPFRIAFTIFCKETNLTFTCRVLLDQNGDGMQCSRYHSINIQLITIYNTML